MKNSAATLTVVLSLILTLVIPAAMAEDRSAEVNAFTTALHSNNIEARITALKKISVSGLTDRTLFDLIRDRLVENYEKTSISDEKKVDELAWLCKALGSSGISEYREVLDMVQKKAPAKKVRGYARQSLGLLESYAQRNTLMTQQTLETQGLSPEDGRLVNLLRAQDVKLKRDAAKTITRSIATNTRVFEIANEELLTLLHKESLTEIDIDTLGWLCKALAASGDGKYKGTLEEVIKSREKNTVQNNDFFDTANQPGADPLLKHATQSLKILK